MDNPYPTDIITVSDETITDPGGSDLIEQFQRRQIDAYIAHERAELASLTSYEIAWLVYPPTPHDDPAEYAPYWAPLRDLNLPTDKIQQYFESYWSPDA